MSYGINLGQFNNAEHQAFTTIVGKDPLRSIGAFFNLMAMIADRSGKGRGILDHVDFQDVVTFTGIQGQHADSIVIFNVYAGFILRFNEPLFIVFLHRWNGHVERCFGETVLKRLLV